MERKEAVFIRIEDLGTHKVAVMEDQRIRNYPVRGLKLDEFRIDWTSLRDRIALLKKNGYPTDQSEAALKALEAAINEEG